MPGTKKIFETDPQKPLIGSLSRVVEHPHKPYQELTIPDQQLQQVFCSAKEQTLQQ